MEFRFAVNDIFHQPVIEIGNTLIPAGFKGDRRQLWDTITKVTDVVNALGTASANAQGLTRPITTSDRLRNSDQQVLYLLIEPSGNQGRGAVTGMLKTGRKALYVFDRDGHHYQVQAPCILDFYVHETRQRSGYGKKLFEHMLKREEVDPKRLAIDRPSDKFLAFLNKHYALNNPIRQMNNFVVYDGFFPKEESKEQASQNGGSPHKGSNGLQAQIITSPYGRYGAPRPPCSMGQIIHNQSATVTGSEQTGTANSFPQYNATPIQQEQPIDPNGKREHQLQMQHPPCEQPLQQNEVSATSDDAHTLAPPLNRVASNPRVVSDHANCTTGSSVPKTVPNKYKIVKMPAVGNGICNDSEEARMERLARVNSAPLNAKVEADSKPDFHWPFAVPTQDYVYEKRFSYSHNPTMASGIHQLLQPDQYMLPKQVVPPKEEVDSYGRPRSGRVANAQPNYHYNPTSAHNQFSNYHQPSYPPRQMSQHRIDQRKKSAQPAQPVNHYNNVTSYSFYAPRPSSSQHCQDLQQMYNDQQRYQQQLEQQYAYEQMQHQQQQQQMWDAYQNWLRYQYMMQYPQVAQSQMIPQVPGQVQSMPAMAQPTYTPASPRGSIESVPLTQQQVLKEQQLQQPQVVQSQVVQPQVVQPQLVQPQVVQPPQPDKIEQTAMAQKTAPEPEVVTPEKLLPQITMEESLRPAHMPVKQNQPVMHEQSMTSIPTYTQRTPTMYNPMMNGSYYQPASYQPMPQQQIPANMSYSTPSVPQMAQYVQEAPKVTPVESTPAMAAASTPSLHPIMHSAAPQMAPSMQQINMPQSLVPLTHEQITQLPPQQQIMYYQNMLAQPTYAQHGMNYNPYNPVFGIPPQPQVMPPVQSNVPPPGQPQQPPQQVEIYEPKESRQIEAKEICSIQSIPTNEAHAEKPPVERAAGDAPISKRREVLAAPYPFPILMKSELEPLQPSIPLRRHTKADVPLGEQQSSTARNKVQARGSPPTLIRPTTVKSARVTNNLLKNSISMARIRSNFDVSGQHRLEEPKAPIAYSLFEPSGSTVAKKQLSNAHTPIMKGPSKSQHKLDNKDLLKRSAMMKEFLNQLS